MTLPDNPLINSTLGLINGDLFAQKIIMGDGSQWGSDSSLTLATIASLSNGYILTDIMTQFSYWYTTGAYTADGAPQTAGDVTRLAIENFRQTQDPFTSGGRITPMAHCCALHRLYCSCMLSMAQTSFTMIQPC